MDRIRPVDIIIMLRKLQKQLMLTVINDVERVSDLLIQIKNNRGSYLINSMQNECQTLCRVSVVFILSKILTCPGLNGLKFSMQSLKKLYYIFFFKGVETKIWRKICHSCVHLWLLLFYNGEVLQISFMIQSFIFFFLGFLQLWSKQNLQKRVNAASHNHSQWMAWFHFFVYCIFGCGYFPGMVPEAVFMIVFIGLFGPPSCASLYSFFFSQENKYIDHLNMMLL